MGRVACQARPTRHVPGMARRSRAMPDTVWSPGLGRARALVARVAGTTRSGQA